MESEPELNSHLSPRDSAECEQGKLAGAAMSIASAFMIASAQHRRPARRHRVRRT
jgi:hypothetical protein